LLKPEMGDSDDAFDECPICTRGHPLDVLRELAATWVTAPVEAPLPGYICVVAKRHVVEPFELPPPERGRFWEDCMVASRALARLYTPKKMNYEIHGNTIPHLHIHVYPRYAGDPYQGGPITGAVRFRRSTESLSEIGRAIDSLIAAGPRFAGELS
jgi:diadenosine tetraphosphate (Ap4A) HIT family hydrolase